MGVWSVDVRTRAAERSERFYEIYGCTPSPRGATISNFYERIHPDDLPRVRAAVEVALRGEAPYREEFRIVRPDGEMRWVHAEGQCLLDGTDESARLTGVVYDVTARKEAEQQLRALTEELEERVHERTRDLVASEQRVRELARALITAEQEERHRIAQVLHDDLQQQLFVLDMTLHLLNGSHTPEEASELRDRAAATIAEASELTRSLSMEMSPPVLAVPHLGEILQWIARHKKKQYGLEIEVDVETPCEVVLHASRVLIYRPLQEALFNIVKHAGTLQVRLQAWEDDGFTVVVVEDEGAGFDVDAVALRRATGGGFGLATMRERIALAGGHFDIDSSPGRGTRVILRVPVAPPTAGEA